MKEILKKIIFIFFFAISFIAISTINSNTLATLKISSASEIDINANNEENTENESITNENEDESKEEDKMFSIEDIVYNRVPIFDVNVFSDTAGGKEIKDNSPVGIIRTVVATWYVSIRNVIVVILSILLIYSGIRMSIATVASDKADYKQFIVGWIKSIVILFTIHYTIAIILNLNDLLVNLFSKGSSNESQMYETIRTRAYSLPFSVGIPGMFMYIALVLIFFRFAWTYIKRTFTVLILIIMAPFIAGKYAFDSASGKKSSSFSAWIYQFCSNVIIQSVHALLYTSIVGISLDLASENITSFIIALIFLNFMISADKLTLRMFKFNNNIQDLQKPFKAKENLSGVFYAYGTVKLTKNMLKNTGDYIKYLGYKRPLREIKENAAEKIDETADKIDDVLLKGTNKLGKNNKLNQVLLLRKISREKSETGKLVKRTLKLKKAQRYARFKSNYKFVLNEIQGVGSAILGIPIMVLSPTTGVGVMVSGYKAFKKNRKQEKLRDWSVGEKIADTVTLGAYGNRLEAKEKNKKSKNQLDTLIKTVNDKYDTISTIKTEMAKINSEEEKLKAKEAMKQVNRLRTESSNIRSYMQDYMIKNKFNDLTEMSDEQKKDMIINVTNNTGAKDVMSIEETDKVGDFIIDTISGRRKNSKFTNVNLDNMSKFISETITKSCMKGRFETLGLQINKLKDNDKATFIAEYEATEDDDNEMLDINRFIDDL